MPRRAQNGHGHSGCRIWSASKACLRRSAAHLSIGNNVWIGASAIILPGVKIGDGSVVGAGSVVTKDVDEGYLYAGNPAVKLKKIDNE